MWHYVLCTGCGQVVMASEPCSCVFEVNGVVDSHGVLHTPERLKLEVLHPTFPPEELALREWRPALAPGPCGDPEWTEEDLAAAVAYMDDVEERAWLQAERAAEWTVQQFVSQLPCPDAARSRETLEQKTRRAVFDMAKGNDVSRIFR